MALPRRRALAITSEATHEPNSEARLLVGNPPAHLAYRASPPELGASALLLLFAPLSRRSREDFCQRQLVVEPPMQTDASKSQLVETEPSAIDHRASFYKSLRWFFLIKNFFYSSGLV